MSLHQIQSRIRVLQRQFADALAVVRARRVAEDMCHQWARTAADNQPLPDELEFCRKLPLAGVKNGEWGSLHRYIRRCLQDSECPTPWDMLRTLLPRARRMGIIDVAFRTDAVALEPGDYQPTKAPFLAFPILS